GAIRARIEGEITQLKRRRTLLSRVPRRASTRRRRWIGCFRLFDRRDRASDIGFFEAVRLGRLCLNFFRSTLIYSATSRDLRLYALPQRFKLEPKTLHQLKTLPPSWSFRRFKLVQHFLSHIRKRFRSRRPSLSWKRFFRIDEIR